MLHALAAPLSGETLGVFLLRDVGVHTAGEPLSILYRLSRLTKRELHPKDRQRLVDSRFDNSAHLLSL